MNETTQVKNAIKNAMGIDHKDIKVRAIMNPQIKEAPISVHIKGDYINGFGVHSEECARCQACKKYNNWVGQIQGIASTITTFKVQVHINMTDETLEAALAKYPHNHHPYMAMRFDHVK